MRIALKRKHANLVIVSVLGRSEGDSNSRTAFDGYTLSRRASSATRASLLMGFSAKVVIFSGFAVIAYEFFSF